MKRFLYIALLLVSNLSFAQLYVLQDHRPDSNVGQPLLYDSLPVLVDSFYSEIKLQDISSMKKFVPTMRYLKATFDTLDVEYTDNKVLVRQQMLLRGLQKDYRKILKKNEKAKVKFRHLNLESTEYDFGEDEEGNRFCYVTMHLKKRKKEYEMRYIAIVLIDKWFIGDKLEFERVD